MKSRYPRRSSRAANVEPNGVISKDGKALGVMINGKPVVGYNTPSRKLELFSKTMADWKWPEFALPEYYRSHIHRSAQRDSLGMPSERFRSATHARSRCGPKSARRGVHAVAHLPACLS